MPGVGRAGSALRAAAVAREDIATDPVPTACGEPVVWVALATPSLTVVE